jgi:hypothetical protein
MSTTIDLQEMTTPDKLRLMEELWQNLSINASEVASPEWHGEVLAERDRLIESGEETFIDWETAKKRLRDELQRKKSRVLTHFLAQFPSCHTCLALRC